MARIKRVLNVPVKDTAQMLDLMKKLGTLAADLEAVSKPGLVRIVLHGTSAEIQELKQKIKDFTKAK
ncbi:MAG: hypothetical protein APZ16_00315 [Candidatus Hadarchaeum yellowstonense]|jgi:hypothetical protein|uniref:Uncharacterized protein n=1 Tax=Hadarchaeum yellowstonense TaxID=1776334 RepID=A0A147JYS4_HADYE|nr:MAG: hypothetical protein APZ16_00315 [Candidatus Hadarchaeum yellowstonense]